MKRLMLAMMAFLLWPALAQAEMTLTGEAVQGGLITGKVPSGTTVTLDGQPLRVSVGGHFVFGFHRDDTGESLLVARFPDGSQQQQHLQIRERDYKVQRIDGLPKNKVTPPESVLKRIKSDAAQVRAARKIDTAETWFSTGFIWPSKGRISGVYGSQRVLNGIPKQPHYGIDVAAPTGTPVIAPAPGRIVLAHKDMYYSGGTVLLDHGHGVMSGFLHLHSVDVVEGQVLQQGEPLGTIGATGRATGPHLDWRINWFEKRIDPGLLVPPMGN